MGNEPNLFVERSGFEESTAWACVVYSLVPFVGIFFSPAALIFAIKEARSVRRANNVSAPRSRYAATAVGIAVLAIQALLWSLLFIIGREHAV